MGDAAALPDHDRGRAPPSPPPQAHDRSADDRSAALRASLDAGRWIEVFSRIAAGVRAAVVPLAGTETGRAQLGVGAGGDTTMELDRAAEAVVFAELEALVSAGEKFSVLSEEAGLKSFGSEYPLVLVDPVDGSLNAKQGVPVFGVMLAVLDGPLVGDALAGLVLNLSTGEEWTAVRAGGARLGAKPLRVTMVADLDRPIELLGLESTPRSLAIARPLVERATKIRILGSMALSIAITAAGGFEAFCAPIPVRVFDMAASLLILAEAGGVATTIVGEPIARARCDLATRTTLLCAPTPAMHRRALAIMGRSG